MQISFCTWIQTNDSFNYGTIFSYATETIDNMFTLTDYNGWVLYKLSYNPNNNNNNSLKNYNWIAKNWNGIRETDLFEAQNLPQEVQKCSFSF